MQAGVNRGSFQALAPGVVISYDAKERRLPPLYLGVERRRIQNFHFSWNRDFPKKMEISMFVDIQLLDKGEIAASLKRGRVAWRRVLLLTSVPGLFQCAQSSTGFFDNTVGFLHFLENVVFLRFQAMFDFLNLFPDKRFFLVVLLKDIIMAETTGNNKETDCRLPASGLDQSLNLAK